jgi:hypothetical protein
MVLAAAGSAHPEKSVGLKCVSRRNPFGVDPLATEREGRFFFWGGTDFGF